MSNSTSNIDTDQKRSTWRRGCNNLDQTTGMLIEVSCRYKTDCAIRLRVRYEKRSSRALTVTMLRFGLPAAGGPGVLMESGSPHGNSVPSTWNVGQTRERNIRIKENDYITLNRKNPRLGGHVGLIFILYSSNHYQGFCCFWRLNRRGFNRLRQSSTRADRFFNALFPRYVRLGGRKCGIANRAVIDRVAVMFFYLAFAWLLHLLYLSP